MSKSNIKTETNEAIAPSKEQMDFLNLILAGIIIVMFVTILALIFSLIAIFGQFIGLKNDATRQLQNSVDKLENTIQLRFPIPTSTPIPKVK